MNNNSGDHALRNFLIKLIAFILGLWIALTYVFGVFRLSGNGMFPALRDGDLCFTYRLDDYYKDDVVVYRMDGQIRFGRVIARAGDTVDGDEYGLLINGGHIAESVQYPTDMSQAVNLPITLGEDEIYVLNDYRPDVGDSRSFGLLTYDQLEGKIIFICRRRGF